MTYRCLADVLSYGDVNTKCPITALIQTEHLKCGCRGGGVLTVIAGVFYQTDQERLDNGQFAPQMSIKHIVPKLGVTGRALACKLGLYPSVTEKATTFAFFIALVIVGNKLICG